MPTISQFFGIAIDYVPAGVEIENAKVDMRQAMQDKRIKHVEFRDDRFVVAARLEGEMNFFSRVRVVTPGKFVMPPTYAEDMYQPMVYGLAGGGEAVSVDDAKIDSFLCGRCSSLEFNDRLLSVVTL